MEGRAVGSPPHALSVETFVRAARRRASLAAGLRSLAVAALAASVGAAAIELDGGDCRAGAAWVVMTLVGALAGASWWREERVEEREFVRIVDARLELEGALATAQDASHPAGASLATLLARRTAARLGARDLLRAAPLPTLGWLAAPLLGCALWLAAEQARPPLAPHLAQLAARVGSSLATESTLEPARAALARELAARVEAGAAGARSDPEQLAVDAQLLAQQLVGLVEGSQTSPEVALELAAAAQRLEAAARDLRPRAPGGGAGSAGAVHAPLASGPEQRTMKGSTAPGPGLPVPSDERDTTRSPNTPLPGSAAPIELLEPPVLSGRWWAAEHDAVVAAWRERP